MPLNAAWAMCGGSSPDKDGSTGTVVGATVSSLDVGVFLSVFRNASIATDAGTYVDVCGVGLAFPINSAVICKLQPHRVVLNNVQIQIVYINTNSGFFLQKKELLYGFIPYCLGQ